MTIKQLGGVFGRNPTFNDVTIEGTLTFDGAIDITSDLTIEDNLYVLGSVGIGTTSVDSNITNGIDMKDFVVGRYDFSSGVPSDGLGGVFSVDANATGFFSGDLVLQCRPGVNSRSIKFYTGNTSTERLKIKQSGDISFYDSAGSSESFLWDASAESLGIGTTSPAAKIDTAYTDTATYSATSPSADLILSRKNTGNTANETVGIRFDITGWSGSTTGGAAIEAIQPSNASTAHLAFLTRDAGTWGERLRITSNGSVGIGTDSPTRKLHVNDESNSIVGRFSSGQTSTWAQFASNSTGTASRIGSPTDDAVASIAVITRDQERLRIDADGHVIIPEGVTLGTAAGTYNADNTLDDYEEGTWTPTVFGQTTAGTYTLTDGGSTYTKVGRKVTVIAKIRDITEVSAGVGNLNIGGLPFAVSVVGQGALRFNTLDVANDSINFSVENYVTSTVYISESKDNASGSVTGLSAITSGTTDIFFTLTYFA